MLGHDLEQWSYSENYLADIISVLIVSRMNKSEIKAQEPLKIYTVAQAFRPKKIVEKSVGPVTNVSNHQSDSEVSAQVRYNY